LQTATFTTRLLGWWGLPWGIIRSGKALISNRKAMENVKQAGPTEVLTDFIKVNLGVIESIRKNDLSIQKMLRNINKENS
jgi:hypothetical protein